MGPQKKYNDYLGRGIHNEKFKKSLTNGNLKQMLIVINNDIDLDVQIRKDYLNIYYKGGNIAKVSSEKSVVFDKFYFYWNMKTIPKKYASQDAKIVAKLTSQKNELTSKFKDGKYEDYFVEAKEVMDKWLDINPKPERMEQHKLSIENQYNKSDYTIIDLEYQVSTKSDFVCTHIPKGKDKPKEPRFDIIAINKQGKLCVIEFKKGTGALGKTSGLKEHWNCYQTSIGRNHQPFMIEMAKLLEQKQTFNLVDKQVKITNPIPEFMFAYSYDDKKSIGEQDKAFQLEYKGVGANIQVIKLAEGEFKLLD
jgi:hypothetical protein